MNIVARNTIFVDVDKLNKNKRKGTEGVEGSNKYNAAWVQYII
jgi:hypothetical protein